MRKSKAVRTKDQLHPLAFTLKPGHEEEDHDHVMCRGIEIARVEYGEVDADGWGIGADIGPENVRCWLLGLH